jgi:hypothetical protein
MGGYASPSRLADKAIDHRRQVDHRRPMAKLRNAGMVICALTQSISVRPWRYATPLAGGLRAGGLLAPRLRRRHAE